MYRHVLNIGTVSISISSQPTIFPSSVYPSVVLLIFSRPVAKPIPGSSLVPRSQVPTWPRKTKSWMQRLVGWVPVSWLGHHAKQLNQQPATTTPTATPTPTALTATPTKQTPETVPVPTPQQPPPPGRQKTGTKHPSNQ